MEWSGAAACRDEKAGSRAVSDSGRYSRDGGGTERVTTAPARIARFCVFMEHEALFTAEII
ncbi:hypothetical protein A2U01_0013764, partial [Trifolium medium]|nr:hypothetical protein [Trifolium medium]